MKPGDQFYENLRIEIAYRAIVGGEVVSAATTVTIVNFEQGDFGINLYEKSFSADLLDYINQSGGYYDGNVTAVQTINANYIDVPPPQDPWTGNPEDRPIREVDGSAGDDDLRGSDQADRMYGGDGNDTVFAGRGSDEIVGGSGKGDDYYDGGLGGDTIFFESATNPIAVDLQSGTASGADIGSDTLVNIENVVGGAGDDQLRGDANGNIIRGGLGNDILDGRTGIDCMIGSAGNDTYFINEFDDVVVEDATGGTDDRVAARTSYALAADAYIEFLTTNGSSGTTVIDLTGNALAQEIIGNAGANVLHDGGVGAADTLKGLGGDDTYRIFNSGDVVVEGSTQGAADRVTAAVSYTLGSGVYVELMTTNGSTSTAAIDLTGNAFAQEIIGNAGENYLSAGGVGGLDTLKGLGGDDKYRIYNAGDTIVEGASGGADDRVLTSVSYTLGSGVYVEHLATSLSAGTVALDLTGNALAQEIVGNAGANVLHDGGAGAADTMTGLGGDDTYRVYNSADVIVEGATQGTVDRVTAAVDYTLGAGVYIELMTTNGSTGTTAIKLTGNEIGQEILGNAGDNRLEGKGGIDSLRGFGGLDTFVFATALGAGNVDSIVDFTVADDRFLLSDAVFTALSTGTLTATAFWSNTTGLAHDANDRIVYRTDTGEVFYDADGTGAAAGILFATITAGLALTNADFSVA